MSPKAPKTSKTPKTDAAPAPFRVPGNVNPYDLVLVGFDSHPGVSADAEDPQAKKMYIQLFDERVHMPLDSDKLAMTRAMGVAQPIQVIEFGGRWFVVDGRRRTLYARRVWDEQSQAGKPESERITVPVIPFQGDINTMFAQSRSLNVHEESTPMMRARDMARLLAEEVPSETGGTRKRSFEEVGAIFGVSHQTVRNMLKLFESSDTVKKALTELKQPTIGLVIADLPEDKQQEVLAELKAEAAAGKKVTVDSAKKKAAAAKGKATASPKDKLESADKAISKVADKWESLPRTEAASKADLVSTIAQLAGALDSVARAIYQGKHAFPTPIKDQEPGYTLVFLANLGD